MALYLYSNPLENTLFDDFENEIFNDNAFDNDDFFGSLIPYSSFGLRHHHRWSPYKKLDKQLRKYFKEDHQKLVDFAPNINLTEDEKNYYIHADLPGMKKDQVKMEINNEDHVLTISGERKSVYKNHHSKKDGEEKENEKETKKSNKKESKLTKSAKESKEIQKKNHFKYSVMECSYGTFSRSFVIPENADLDSIQAKMENGVLEVTISKIEKEQKNKNRSIQIQ